MEANPVPLSIILLLLIAVKALITCARTALAQLNESAVRRDTEEGDERKKKKAARVLLLLDREDKAEVTAQFLLTAISAVAGILFEANFVSKEPVWISCLQVLAFLIVLILFGSIIPSRLTCMNPEGAAETLGSFLLAVMVLLKPIIALLNGVSWLIMKLLRIKPEDLEGNVTEEEIISIVNEGFEQGVLEDDEVEMISNIIELDGKEVRDVMTNRRNVVSVSSKLSIEEAFRFMLGENYSRFPLYEDEKDNVVGIIHFKDVAQHYVAGEGNKMLGGIARTPYFVPDTQGVDTLLHTMQEEKIHMAIAVDEYGQLAGIVALEDILEEIVGNILDEYDIDERMILKQGENRYVMRGMADLADVEETLGITVEQEEYDTLNGFLISLLGRLPADGEQAAVHYQGYRFQVLGAKNNVIRTVRVVKEQEPQNIKIEEKKSEE